MPITKKHHLKGIPGHWAGKNRGPKANHLKPTDAAWLAGLFDGEGCVMITPRPSRLTPDVKIQIQMTNREVIEKVQFITGVGKVSLIDYESGRYDNHGHKKRNQFRWVAYAANACDLLSQMMPWLIEKRKKAKSAIHKYEAGVNK